MTRKITCPPSFSFPFGVCDEDKFEDAKQQAAPVGRTVYRRSQNWIIPGNYLARLEAIRIRMNDGTVMSYDERRDIAAQIDNILDNAVDVTPETEVL